MTDHILCTLTKIGMFPLISVIKVNKQNILYKSFKTLLRVEIFIFYPQN